MLIYFSNFQQVATVLWFELCCFSKIEMLLSNFYSQEPLDLGCFILASNHYKLVLTLLTMHLSDSKREFFAPRGGREICTGGPLSLNGNAAAADKVRAASNSNAVLCKMLWGQDELKSVRRGRLMTFSRNLGGSAEDLSWLVTPSSERKCHLSTIGWLGTRA